MRFNKQSLSYSLSFVFVINKANGKRQFGVFSVIVVCGCFWCLQFGGLRVSFIISQLWPNSVELPRLLNKMPHSIIIHVSSYCDPPNNVVKRCHQNLFSTLKIEIHFIYIFLLRFAYMALFHRLRTRVYYIHI